MTTMALPGEDHLPQHMQSLAKANRVRVKRTQTKRWISSAPRAESLRRLARILDERPWECETMAIAELLICVPRMGWTAARKMLSRVPVPENKAVGAMTQRQRAALSEGLLELAAKVSR